MASEEEEKKPKRLPPKIHSKVMTRHGRSLSSSRLAKTNKLGPLHHVDEDSPPTSDSSEAKEKFRRSKSSDSLTSRRNDSSRRIAPMSAIRVSRSQTRMTKHSPSSKLAPLMVRHAHAAHRAKDPVIELEQEDTDEDEQENHRHTASDSSYEDVPESVTSSTVTTQKDEFKPSLLPNLPAPPKLSTETVVALAADSSPPKQHADLTSTSIPLKATSWADLHRAASKKSPNEPSSPTSATSAVSPTTRTQQKLWLQRQNMEGAVTDGSALLSPEKKREFERITKEYINVRKYTNPIIESIERIRTVRVGASTNLPLHNPKQRRTSVEIEGLSQSLPKRVTSLSATTLNSMADFNLEDNNPYNGSWHKDITSNSAATAAAIGTVPYLLQKIWTEGWKDPSIPEETTTPDEDGSCISSQALRAQQQLNAGSRQRLQSPGMNRIKIV